MFQFLLQIICSFVFVLLVPFLVPISLLFRLYRSFGTRLNRWKDPKVQLVDGPDAVWLQDTPNNRAIINGIFELEGEFTLDDIQDVVQLRFLGAEYQGKPVGHFNSKIEYRFRRPVWVEDDKFDLTKHVSLHGNDGEKFQEKDLPDIVSHYCSMEMDRNRPLWNMILVPIASGNSLLIVRVHHVYGDGISMVRFIMKFFVDECPQEAELRVQRYGSRINKWLIALKVIVEGPYGMLKELLTPYDNNAFHGPPLTGKKVVAWSEGMSLSTIKQLKAATNTTVNDVLIAILSRAMQKYCESENLPVPPHAKAYIPVDVRSAQDTKPDLENHFSVVFFDLPLDKDNVMKCLKETSDRMKEIKRSSMPLVNYFVVIYAMARLPSSWSKFLFNELSRKSSMVISNVPGPTKKLYLMNQPIRRLNFWAPGRQTTGLTVSIISYNGQVFLGLLSDEALIKDPQKLIKCYTQALDELKRAVLTKDE